MSVYRAEYVYSKRRVYAAVTPPRTPPPSSANILADEMAAFRSQRSRRQAVQDLGSPGHTAVQSSVEACERYLRRNPIYKQAGIRISPTIRASHSPEEDGTGSSGAGLGGRAVQILQSPDGPGVPYTAENCTRRSQGDNRATRLEEQNVVSSSQGYMQSMGNFPTEGEGRVVRSTSNPQLLAPGSRRHWIDDLPLSLGPSRTVPPEDAGTRRAASCVPVSGFLSESRGALQSEILCGRINDHLKQVLGGAPGSSGVSKLLTHTSSSKTISRKATQLASFDKYMRTCGLSYPATGVQLACWISCVYENRLRGLGPAISAASLPGYLSGIRTSLVALGHPRLPTMSDCFVLREVYKAYCRWDSSWSEAQGTVAKIRIAIPAKIVSAMMGVVMFYEKPDQLRDLAMIVLARAHGLRADSTQAVRREDFQLTPSGWTVIISALKGHTREQARRYGARRFIAKCLPSFPYTCREVMDRWLSLREDSEPLLFGKGCSLDDAVKRLLDLLHVEPPTGCYYSSHSVRSAAFTESCLLGDVNMGVLMMQYNWVSLAMPKIYFDHRLTLTPAASIFTSDPMTGSAGQ